MSSFSSQIGVAVDAEASFAVVAKLETHPAWSADELVIRRKTASTYESVAEAKGRTFHAQVEIIEETPPRRFVFDVRDQTGHYRHTIEVEQTEVGSAITRTVQTVDLSPAQTVLYWMALWGVRKPALRDSMARLKAHLEE